VVLSKNSNLNYWSRVLLRAISVGFGFTFITYFPFNNFIYDTATFVKPHIVNNNREPNVVVIEIDDSTLQTLNQYPLSRHYYITALKNINNASLVIIDILFTGFSPYDSSLSELAQKKGNLVLATTIFDECLPSFYEHAAAIGHAFVPYDANKNTRKFPQSNSLYWSSTYLYQLMGFGSITDGYDYLVWPRKKDFIVINFRELLINPIDVEGKIVLIGYTSTATDDTVRIPLRGVISGVYVHASYIYNSINNTGLYGLELPLPLYILLAFVSLFIPKKYSLSIYTLGAFLLVLLTSYYLQVELVIISCLFHLIIKTIVNIVLKSKFLEDIAFKDGLTNILNRRALDLKAKEAWEIYPYISVLMMDIDFFKKYNDKYGHPQGDVTLKSVAQAIKTSVREKDIVARYGGEEFTIIIFSLNKPSRERMEDICKSVNVTITDLNIKHEDSPHSKITLSVGAITVESNKVPYEKALDLADRELYKSKHGGRNTYHYSEI